MKAGETQRRLKVLLASPRGFCAGVERAIEIVERALQKFGAPIYVYHEIVHNKHVVEDLRNKGAVFVDELSVIPQNSIVIFSAHGVSTKVKKDAEDRDLKSIDATCPLVTKVHREVQKYNSQNKKLILIGHENHPEVKGTSGQIDRPMALVQSIEDIKNLPFSEQDDLAYVTQTTLSVDDTKNIIDALVQKYPAIEGPNLKDICYATQNRQNAVRVLSKEVDLLLVIGAKNSSNSNRLKDLGIEMGIQSYLIDDEHGIDYSWFDNINTLGITAGASAPEILLERILEALKSRYNITVSVISSVEERVKFALPTELETTVC